MNKYEKEAEQLLKEIPKTVSHEHCVALVQLALMKAHRDGALEGETKAMRQSISALNKKPVEGDGGER